MFADTDQQGRPKQQDADECWNTILQSWREPLKKNAANNDLIARLFEIELENQTKCVENPDEPASVSHESVLRLSCFIENGAKPVDLIQDGIRMGLEGQIEKNSPSLGRNALYSKESRINKLPSYLCVNFVRFYFKQASEVAGTEAGRAKILRSVTFSKTLDVFEFCSDSLKK